MLVFIREVIHCSTKAQSWRQMCKRGWYLADYDVVSPDYIRSGLVDNGISGQFKKGTYD